MTCWIFIVVLLLRVIFFIFILKIWLLFIIFTVIIVFVLSKLIITIIISAESYSFRLWVISFENCYSVALILKFSSINPIAKPVTVLFFFMWNGLNKFYQKNSR